MKQQNPHRVSRLNEAMRVHLVNILRQSSNDPRLNNLNITAVEVAKDLSVAKVFYTDLLSVNYLDIDVSRDVSGAVDLDVSLSGEGNKTFKKDILKQDKSGATVALKKALEKASGFLRKELSSKMDLRKTPQLRFVYDASIDRANRIESLLKNIDN